MHSPAAAMFGAIRLTGKDAAASSAGTSHFAARCHARYGCMPGRDERWPQRAQSRNRRRVRS